MSVMCVTAVNKVSKYYRGCRVFAERIIASLCGAESFRSVCPADLLPQAGL